MGQAYDQYNQLREMGRHLEAADLAATQYLQGNPNNVFWLTRQAAALIRAGDFQRALDVASEAQQLQPNNSYAIYAVGEALFKLNRIAEASPYFESILTDSKLGRHAYRKFLECLAASKKWDKILQHLEQAQIPSETGYPWKVKALQGQKRLDEAMHVCRQWLAESPDNRRGLWALTDLEIQRDGLEPVLSRMAKIARIPSRPPIYKEIYASLCRRAGKPELALKQYEKIARVQADPQIHRKQAFTLSKSGREPEAIPLFEELLKFTPADVYLNNAYIAAAGRIGQLPRALAFYEELLSMHPGENRLYGRIRKVNKLLEQQPPHRGG